MTKPKINYQKKESPLQNIQRLFGIFKIMNYNVVIKAENGQSICKMFSCWGDLRELRERLIEMETNFQEALVNFSTSKEMQDYSSYLRILQIELTRINGHFTYPTERVKFKVSDESTGRKTIKTDFENLDANLVTIVKTSHNYISLFFKNLQECVHHEKQEWERRNYVKSQSAYGWMGRKNEFSELALGIFVSGALRRTDSEKLKASTFARELAAFFGIDKLNFDQDIELISNRQKRIQGKVFDKCKLQLQKDLEDRRKFKKK